MVEKHFAYFFYLYKRVGLNLDQFLAAAVLLFTRFLRPRKILLQPTPSRPLLTMRLDNCDFRPPRICVSSGSRFIGPNQSAGAWIFRPGQADVGF